MGKTRPGLESRFKYLHVNDMLIMQMVEGLYKRDAIKLPCFVDLPEGYKVIAVEYEFSRQGFLFKIYHPSFPIQEMGMTGEFIDSGIEYETFDLAELKKKDDLKKTKPFSFVKHLMRPVNEAKRKRAEQKQNKDRKGGE